MWICKIVLKLITDLSEGLYNLHMVSFIVSIGSVSESLALINVLDEEDNNF